MLTNNFYKAVAGALSGNTERNMKEMTKTDGTVTSSLTSSYAVPNEMNPFCHMSGVYSANNSQLTSANGGGILIGTGTTPPTVNDYKLENQITSGFGSTTSFPNSDSAVYNTKGIVSCCTITNSSQTDNLVINEIGYIKGRAGYWNILYDRIVLDTSITIAPGATKTIEYRLNMPKP